MLDDLFELILLIFGDIFDFFRIGWKEKKGKTARKKPVKSINDRVCKGVKP